MTKVYVEADDTGKILTVFSADQPGMSLTARDDQDPDIQAYLNPQPSRSGLVDSERNRRVSAGFIFSGVLYQSAPEDRENIMGASTAALAAIMTGATPGDYRWSDPDADFVWIDAANDSHLMDAQTMFAFGKTALVHKQGHIFAGRALKDMTPIPADYADDKYWP